MVFMCAIYKKGMWAGKCWEINKKKTHTAETKLISRLFASDNSSALMDWMVRQINKCDRINIIIIYNEFYSFPYRIFIIHIKHHPKNQGKGWYYKQTKKAAKLPDWNHIS